MSESADITFQDTLNQWKLAPSKFAANYYKTKIEIGETYVREFKKSFDIDLTFFSHKVSPETNYIVVISSVIVLIGIYIVIHLLKKRSKNR